jgi:ribose/xylose/arabinose/galactoside ABC-type transport system permease subunit
VSDEVLAPAGATPAPTPAPPATSPSRGRRPSWQQLTQRYGAAAVLAGLFLYNAVATPYFLTYQSLVVNQLRQAVPVAIVALGMALVISTGGIDLSVGSVMAIAGQVGALLIVNGSSAYVGWTAALLVGVACGLFNGVLVARYGVQPIIATLILLIAGRGIAQLVTGGNLQNFDDPLFQFFGFGRVAGLPAQIAVCAVVAAVVAAVLRWTTLGRYVVAVGGNENSARLAGVPVARTKLLVYVTSGVLAALVGLIVVGVNSSSDANNVGLNMELAAIAAVAVAGVPLTGGRMTVVGTLVGALTLKLLENTLVAHGISRDIALIIQGAVIILALYVQRSERQS